MHRPPVVHPIGTVCTRNFQDILNFVPPAARLPFRVRRRAPWFLVEIKATMLSASLPHVVWQNAREGLAEFSYCSRPYTFCCYFLSITVGGERPTASSALSSIDWRSEARISHSIERRRRKNDVALLPPCPCSTWVLLSIVYVAYSQAYRFTDRREVVERIKGLCSHPVFLVVRGPATWRIESPRCPRITIERMYVHYERSVEPLACIGNDSMHQVYVYSS